MRYLEPESPPVSAFSATCLAVLEQMLRARSLREAPFTKSDHVLAIR